MHTGTRTVPTEMSGNSSDINSRANETFWETYARLQREAMSGPNSSDINSRANETFWETYARLQREAWASGSSLDGVELYLAVLLTLLTVRLVGWLAHRRAWKRT